METNLILKEKVPSATQEYLYTKFAENFDLILTYRETEKEVKFINHILKENKKIKKILDCGCATGRITIPLAKKGYQVTGLDVNQPLLDEGRKKNSEVEFIYGDMTCLPFENKSFDAVISTWSAIAYAYNNEELDSFCREAARITAEHGVILIDTANPLEEKNKENKRISENEILRITTKRKQKILDNVRYNQFQYEFHYKTTGEKKEFKEKSLEKLWRAEELKQNLTKHGFKKLRFYGGFDATSYKQNSERLIIFAAKE
ncbi:MAG: methyltransferase domain-containing protein [Candidatus Micrarchaeota archaeon]